MKAKKALKKLNKVEALLSNVIKAFPSSENGLGELLGTAKTTIERAIESVSASTEGTATKSTARAKKASSRRLSAMARKRRSIAAKKRSAAAKRNRVHAATDQRLSKTA